MINRHTTHTYTHHYCTQWTQNTDKNPDKNPDKTLAEALPKKSWVNTLQYPKCCRALFLTR